jgi:DNA modification methylase
MTKSKKSNIQRATNNTINHNIMTNKKQNKNFTVYKLGSHFLVQGDSTDPNLEIILKDILQEEKISLILSDPPYGVQYKTNKHKEILNDEHQSDEQYSDFTSKYLKVVKPYLAEYNAFYLFNSDKMYIPMVKAIKSEGFKYSQQLVWVKNQAVLGRMDFHLQHELIAYGWYKKHKFYKTNDRSVLQCPKPSNNRFHPTEKPTTLLRRLILNSSKSNDIVYDPFAGSGTTLLSCEQTKRQCISVELEEQYIQVILQRFQKATGIQPIQCHINLNQLTNLKNGQ